MKNLTIVIFSILISLSGQAQNLADSIINDLFMEGNCEFDFYESNPQFQFLYAGSSYEHQVYFAGRETGIENLSAFGSYLFYFHSSGWGAGLLGAGYDNIEPHYNSTIVTIGYSGKSKKHSTLRYRSSYSRYFAADSEQAGSYKNTLSAGFTLKNKYLGSRLDASLPFGKDALSASVSLDGYLDFTLIDRKKFKLDIEPELSVYCGNETIYLTETFMYTGETYEYSTQSFGWMNTALEFPLSLNLGNFDFEAAYSYNFPRSLGTEEFTNTWSFSLALGYMIGL